MGDEYLIRAESLAMPSMNKIIRGQDTNVAFDDAGLSPSIVEDLEAKISADIYLAVLDHFVHISRTSQFAFRAGLEGDLRYLGLLGQALLSAPRLEEAIDIACLGLNYVQDGGGLVLDRQNGRCQIRYEHSFSNSLSIHDEDITMGILTNILGKTAHGPNADINVFYPSARNSNIQINGGAYATAKSSSVGFIEFDERLLHSPMRNFNETRFSVLMNFHKAFPYYLSREFRAETIVECLLMSMVGIMKPSAHLIAHLIGIGERRLRRLLHREGTNYRSILEKVRKVKAPQLIEMGHSITDVAFGLGYDHPENFSTAFRRWFGRSPSEMEIDTISK